MEGEVIYQDRKSTLSKFDHLDAIKKLAINTIVHGDFALPPLENIERGALFGFIRAGWEKLGIGEGNRLQRCAWPQIVRGNDGFIVSTNKGGKTLSYLAPICAMLISNVVGWKQLSGKGPVALILTHNTYKAIVVEHFAETLLNSSTTNQIQVMAITSLTAKTHSLCSKGVEILVTTPELFLENAGCFDWLQFDRLKFFVVDDVHCGLRTKKELIYSVFYKYQNICTGDLRLTCPQLIVCGAEWSKDVESLFWDMPRKPTVIIGSLKAAIPYGRIKCRVQYVEAGYKLGTLISLLEKQTNNPSFNRIIVACGSPEVCRVVYNIVADLERYRVRLCSVRNQDEMKANFSIWNAAAKFECVVFIADDEVLKYFDIKEATYLIHYDIDDLSITTEKNRGSVFFNRFLCLWNNMRNICDGIVAENEKAMCDILVTTEEKDLDRIVKTFLSIGFEFPSVILKRAFQMRRLKEKKWPLCPSLKLTGQCETQQLGNCEYRHTASFDELTKKPTIPRSGAVEVRIVQFSTVNCYIGQVIRYFPDEQGEPQDMLTDLNDRHSILLNHFKEESNRIPPASIVEGSLCAVATQDNQYTRGKISKILTRSYNDTPDSVRVFCIDTGENVTRKAQVDLYKLPADLESLPFLSVEIILVGLQPPSNASEYSIRSLKRAKTLVLDKIFKGKICMSLDNTIWISSMSSVSGDNLSLRIREELIQNKSAASNPLHEHWIWTMTPKTLDASSDPFFANNFYNEDVGFDWAFLPLGYADNPTTHLFSVTFVDSPHRIFGNYEPFIELLDKLNGEILLETQDLIRNRYKEYTEHFMSQYSVGKVVLVEEDDKWYRGIITEIIEDDVCYDEWGDLLPKSTYTYYAVFLVDYGDIHKVQAKSLFPILKKFVSRLPFQAICIRLYHIVPTEYEWNQKSIDYLKNKLEISNINVRVSALHKHERKSKYPSFKYDAMAFTLNGPYDELGEELVTKDLAEYMENGHELYKKIKEILDKKPKKSKEPTLPTIIEEEEEEEVENVWDEHVLDANVWDFNFSGYLPIGSSPIIGRQENKENRLIDENNETDPAALVPTVSRTSPFLLPLTRWRQTPSQIILTVYVPDIHNEEVFVGPNRELTFSCDPNYKFDIQTFGHIDDGERKLTGQNLQLKFKKRVIGIWPHLTRMPESLHWLRTDYSDMALSFDDDDDEPDADVPVSFLQNSQPENSDGSADEDVDYETL